MGLIRVLGRPERDVRDDDVIPDHVYFPVTFMVLYVVLMLTV